MFLNLENNYVVSGKPKDTFRVPFILWYRLCYVSFANVKKRLHITFSSVAVFHISFEKGAIN
jgi:hypothetical protein